MAKDITIKNPQGTVTYYPKTVSQLVYDNNNGKTVATEIGELVDDIEAKPDIVDGVDTDLDFADESGNVLVRFSDGHIKTKNFDSSDIDFDIPVDIADESGNATDLDIADESGNVLVRFSDGHIKTKNFDSSDIDLDIESPVDVTDGGNVTDLDFADESGNVLMRVSNGHIKTKNFDSRDLSDEDKHYVHFSFDDVQHSINSLFTGNYTSIYDHPFFAFLKTLHNSYGAVFTMNLFTTVFNKMTNKFASEFSAASSWLKWTLHGNNYSSEGSTDGGTDWANMVNAVITMTGNPNCINRHARLSSFLGTTQNITDMRNQSLGLVCLSASETEDRLSYNFDANEQKYVFNNNVYYQGLTNLHFVRSYTRFDSKVWSSSQGEIIKAYINTREFSDFFIHEYSLFNGNYQMLDLAKTYLTNFFDLVKVNGFTPSFWTIK